MDKEKLKINKEEDRVFEEAKKFVEEHIYAFKELADGPDTNMEKSQEAYKNLDNVKGELMDKYDKAFKELAKSKKLRCFRKWKQKRSFFDII